MWPPHHFFGSIHIIIAGCVLWLSPFKKEERQQLLSLTMRRLSFRTVRFFGGFFFFLWLTSPVAHAVGGAKAVFSLDQTSGFGHTSNETRDIPRQDLCGRYIDVLEGRRTMRDSLRGLELRPILRVGKFFRYSDQFGIDENDPGIMALLLDEIGRRAGFTWRQSFAVTYGPSPNTTFSDLLVWSVQNFDLSVNWWDETLERLERGVSFVRPWFDGSLILIEKQDEPEVDDDTITFANWLRPFTPNVWWAIILTVLTSGLTWTWIEHLADDKYRKQRRTVWQGFCDGVYLSAINFPQNYEFQPTTAAGRIFGISISIWALVVTATYTANLASLLVDRKPATRRVESMDDVIALGIPVCTYANTGMDQYIQRRYRSAKRIPLSSELATYDALHEGRCELTVSYYQNWLGFERNRTYNPDCDLAWVGRTVKRIQSGFAVNADVGFLCSSLIRDVLNIYMDELFSTDYMDDLWDEEYSKTQDINCEEVAQQGGTSEEAALRRRRLEDFFPDSSVDGAIPNLRSFRDTSSITPINSHGRRKLKAGSRGSAAVGGASESESDERLTLNQMAGTFLLHYGLSVIAILVGYVAQHRKKSEKLVKRSFHSLSQKWKRSATDRERSESSGREEEEEEKSSGHKDKDEDKMKHEAWQSRQEELRETKKELQEMGQRLERMVSLLTELKCD